MIPHIGIQHLKTATIENFAGGFGIRLWRGFSRCCIALRLGTQRG